MRGRHAAVIQMSQQTRATLQGWLQRQKTPLGRAKRARAMVLLEQGHSYAHMECSGASIQLVDQV